MKVYKKGKAVKVTANFKSTEFDCKGSGCCTETVIDESFVKQLQTFREYLNVRLGEGVSININSGYRCEKHNRDIGGSSTSKHCKGRAADIIVKQNGKTVDAKRVCCLAQDFGFDGIEYIDSGALHVDNRGYEWRTYQMSRTYFDVADFWKWTKLKREANPYKFTAVSVKKGSKGESVCYVKYALYALGLFPKTYKVTNKYCGNGTVKAIKAFQKKYGLTVDGKFGPACVRKLKEIW